MSRRLLRPEGWLTRAPLWPAVGLAVLFTYSTWALWLPMNGEPRIFDGYLSELSASDQPNNLFFRGGDLLTSLIVGAMGIRALTVWPRVSPHRRRWWLLAAGSLVLFAVATFVDAFFSMDCSPTLSAGCRVLEETGQLSAVHYAHTYTSVGAQAGVSASMIAAYVALRRSGTGGRRGRYLLLAGCVGETCALGVFLVMFVAGIPGLGYPQVVMVLIGSVWFAAVGVSLGSGAFQGGADEHRERQKQYAE